LRDFFHLSEFVKIHLFFRKWGTKWGQKWGQKIGVKISFIPEEDGGGTMTNKMNITEPILFINGPLAEVLGGKAGETIWIKLEDAERMLESLKAINGVGRLN
jgi:hypothetical protein